MPSIREFLDQYFEISARNSDFLTEIRGGLATFMTMSYIIFVNPLILSNAGVPYEGLFVATALIAAIMTILMGVYGKYPYAIAPGMGLNAFVAYSLVLAMGLPWQAAMAIIFWEGLLVTILVVLGLRERVMDALPNELKLGIGIGIGAFIAFIGFVNSKLVVAAVGIPVTAGSWMEIKGYAIIAIVGLIVIAWLWHKNVKGSILLGIIITAVIANILSMEPFASLLFNPENPNFAPPVDFSKVKFEYAFDVSTIGAIFSYDYLIKPIVDNPSLIGIIVAVMLSDFFDTMGTLTGIGEQGGFIDENGRHRNLKELLIVDSLGAMFGGIFGTSSATTYIESAAGVSEGAKTGFASVVTGLMFLLSLVLFPLIYLIPEAATAPALIFIGFLMIQSVNKIEFTKENIAVALAAFAAIFFMPFTYSIASGIALGILIYVLLSVLTGKWREIDWSLYIFTIFFIIYFLYLP